MFKIISKIFYIIILYIMSNNTSITDIEGVDHWRTFEELKEEQKTKPEKLNKRSKKPVTEKQKKHCEQMRLKKINKKNDINNQQAKAEQQLNKIFFDVGEDEPEQEQIKIIKDKKNDGINEHKQDKQININDNEKLLNIVNNLEKKIDKIYHMKKFKSLNKPAKKNDNEEHDTKNFDMFKFLQSKILSQ